MKNCNRHPEYSGSTVPYANCRDCRNIYIKKNWERFTVPALAQKMGLAESTVKGYMRRLGLEHTAPAQVAVEHARELRKLKEDQEQLRKKNRILTSQADNMERELEAVLDMKQTASSYQIEPRKGDHNEAAAVIVASDWHVEEVVKPEQVSGLNNFNAGVCKDRVRRFFTHSMKLLEKEQQGTEINKLVFALLGDFITGSIHADLAETNRKLPTHAIIEVHNHLKSGIEYMLETADIEEMVVVCHSGNHGRFTSRQRTAAEAGNSLERYLYFSLKQEFANDDRVTFIIPEGYMSYITVLGYTIRFHHGHAIRYRGGVGGLTIPANKAIAKWDKARKADLTVFGHFHQFFDSGDFICNGSLIGYNAYALSIKASYEPAKQAFFLVDKDDGKTIVAPIILEHDK